MSIVIIDSGIANLHSVCKGMEFTGADVSVTDRFQNIISADVIVLPGVGAFDPGMRALKQKNLIHPIQDAVAAGKTLLGICLGMQLLFDRSAEGEELGLGIIPGEIRLLPRTPGLPLPHMGWNQLEFTQSHPLWQGLPANSWVYFVHSFYAEPQNRSVITATVEYGDFHPAAAVAHKNVMGLQFHPEKSADRGLQILQNFVNCFNTPQREINYV